MSPRPAWSTETAWALTQKNPVPKTKQTNQKTKPNQTNKQTNKRITVISFQGNVPGLNFSSQLYFLKVLLEHTLKTKLLIEDTVKPKANYNADPALRVGVGGMRIK